jgi:hypothetical protein
MGLEGLHRVDEKMRRWSGNAVLAKWFSLLLFRGLAGFHCSWVLAKMIIRNPSMNSASGNADLREEALTLSEDICMCLLQASRTFGCRLSGLGGMVFWIQRSVATRIATYTCLGLLGLCCVSLLLFSL